MTRDCVYFFLQKYIPNMFRIETCYSDTKVFNKKKQLVCSIKKLDQNSYKIIEYKYANENISTPILEIEIQNVFVDYLKITLKIDNEAPIENITMKQFDDNYLYIDRFGKVVLLEYKNMNTRYFLKPIKYEYKLKIMECIDVCKKVIEEMRNPKYDNTFNILTFRIFKDHKDIDELKDDFDTIKAALNNLKLEIPQNIINKINNFNSNESNYLFISYYPEPIGLSIYEHVYTEETYNYFNKNIICIGKSYFKYFKDYNWYPNRSYKSFCETLIHETAHMSLNLYRDRIFALCNSLHQSEIETLNASYKKENENEWHQKYDSLNADREKYIADWDEQYFMNRRDIKKERTLVVWNQFLEKYNNNTYALCSNAEHYAIFFVMFYLQIYNLPYFL